VCDYTDRFERDLAGSLSFHSRCKLLVAVSGGPDSTALVRLLWELREKWGRAHFPELLVAHVDHGLRGEASRADAAFVEALAGRLSCPFLLGRGDARREAQQRGSSPEAAARELRYEFFRDWVLARSVDALVLAHHADDQAETVILRAVRGSGVRGLGAMADQRSLWPPSPEPATRTGVPRVLRPLLGWRREELLAFLAERGESYRTDATNDDVAVPRNRVRLEVLPALEAVQPGAVESLARLAKRARRLRSDVEALGARALKEAVVVSPTTLAGFRVDTSLLRIWPESVVHAALELAWARLLERVHQRGGLAHTAGATLPVLGAGTLETLTGWVHESGPRQGRLELRDGCTVELRYGCLWFVPPPANPGASDAGVRSAVASSALPSQPQAGRPLVAEASVSDTGRANWGNWHFELREDPQTATQDGTQSSSQEDGGAAPRVLEERVDADAVAARGQLQLRSRREGDRWRPLGAPGTTTLKEFFRYRRVRPVERDQVPLLVAGDDIVWVVGHRLGHVFRVRPETKRVWTLRAWCQGAGD